MDNIEQILGRLGLTPSEARVYLIGVRHENIGVQEFSRLSELKRPTIYHALHQLEAKGLLTKKGTGRRLVFSMQPPERLRHVLDEQAELIGEKRELLESIMPFFIPSTVSSTSSIQVQHIEGIEGMKTVVDEALYCKTREWSILAPRHNFFSDMEPAHAKAFLTTRKARGIKARSLWERPETVAMRGRSLTIDELQDRRPRYLPAAFSGRFSATLILFDDKAVFLSSFRERHGILVQAQEVHDLLLMMFDGLWLSSEPYEKYVGST